MRQAKKMLVLWIIMIFFSSIYVGTNAQAMTKRQVNTKITSLKKEIKILQGKRKKEKAREKKETAGTVAIYAEVISYQPYILHNMFDFDSGGYFWVKNKKHLSGISGIGGLTIAAAGFVKLTGKYKNYNGITCAECNSVKVTIKSTGIQKKIDAKKETLKKYKNVLKDKVILEKQTIKVGKTKKIPRYWKYSGAYNSLIWESDDPEIAMVDQKGRVTAQSAGTATITAKASLSGIVSQCKVIVIEMEDDTEDQEDVEDQITENELYFETTNYEVDREDGMDYVTLRLYAKMSVEDFGNITIESSNEDVAIVEDWSSDSDSDDEFEFIVKIVGKPGTTTITVTSESGLSAQCMLTYTDENYQEYSNTEYDEDYGNFAEAQFIVAEKYFKDFRNKNDKKTIDKAINYYKN